MNKLNGELSARSRYLDYSINLLFYDKSAQSTISDS